MGAVLNRLQGRLYYWRERNDEVDFIFESDRTYAIEVKSGKKRKAGGLTAFMGHYPDAVPVFVDVENYPQFEAHPERFLALMADKGGRL